MLKETDFGFEVKCDVCSKPKNIHLLKEKTIEACVKKLNEFKWFATKDEQICTQECKQDWDEIFKGEDK